jgi:lysophospholipid acyltransferase (LPLAT)-like uncharacterized protein
LGPGFVTTGIQAKVGSVRNFYDNIKSGFVMIKKWFQKFLYRYFFPYAGVFLVRLLSATYRIRIVDSENEFGLIKAKKGLVYASWHQRFFPGITFFSSRRPIAIIISQSRDGEMAARAVEILGWKAVRGSSTRGGKQALEEIKTLGSSGYKVGHIVDGPQGPFGKVKPGIVRIAQYASLPIVPTITSGQQCWVFNSWDRFMVPKPFSRVIIRFGLPVWVPENLTSEKFNAIQGALEERLAGLYEDTDRIWDDPERFRKFFS